MSKLYDAFEKILSSGVGDKRVSDTVVAENALAERNEAVKPITPIASKPVAPDQSTPAANVSPAPVVAPRPAPVNLSDDIAEFTSLTGVEYDAQPYYDESRERRLKAKQKALLLADAFRVMGQGIAGSNGMLIDRDPQNTGMQRTQAELDRMRELYDADVRRTRDLNLNKRIREAELERAQQMKEDDFERNMLLAGEIREEGYDNQERLENMRQQNYMERETARFANDKAIEGIRAKSRIEVADKAKKAAEEEEAKKTKAYQEFETHRKAYNSFIDAYNAADRETRIRMSKVIPQRLLDKSSPTKEDLAEIYEYVKNYKPASFEGQIPKWTKDTKIFTYEYNGKQFDVPASQVEEMLKEFESISGAKPVQIVK